MNIDALQAALMAFLPIALLTFAITHFSFRNGDIGINDDKKDDWDIFGKKQAKSQKGEAPVANNYLHKKWVSFGGGFYGLMALITFFVIELRETLGFIESIEGWHTITNLLNIGSMVDLVIASIMNFVTAMIWFTYWPDTIDMTNGWIWLGMAYGGYHFGRKFAEFRLGQKKIEASREQ